MVTLVDYATVAFGLPRETPDAFGNGSFVLPLAPVPSQQAACGAALYRPIAASSGRTAAPRVAPTAPRVCE